MSRVLIYTKLGRVKSILLIESDLSIRVALQTALELEGYKVFSADNGADALALLKKIEPPALILLDWQMPFMNGEKFLEIKVREKSIAKIPTIVISAKEGLVLMPGVVEVIKKPFDLAYLYKAVRLYCG